MRPFVRLDNLMRLVGGTGAFREVRLPPGYRVDHSQRYSQGLILRPMVAGVGEPTCSIVGCDGR
jgi:hypothetical protein